MKKEKLKNKPKSKWQQRLEDATKKQKSELKMKKAIALFSGGLDSLLAIKIVKEQGIDVEALNIKIGFSSSDNSEYLQRKADELGVKLTIVNDIKNFTETILWSPVNGYGKNLNPCVDCHSNMLKIAWEYAQRYSADFIITGEVLNQRPMSQTYTQLRKVNNSTDFQEYIVRPLSAKNLPTSIPEKEGWVDRDKFYAINGRSRKVQIALAEQYGIMEYETPGGGCLLTEKGSTNKIKAIKNTTGSLDVTDVSIVSKGRYFKIGDTLLITGCNKSENDFLREIKSDKYSVIEPPVVKGPTSLVYNVTEKTKEIVARIILKYCKLTEKNNVLIIDGKKVESQPFTENEHLKYIIQ